MEITNQYDISIITPFYKGNQYIEQLANCIEKNKQNSHLNIEWVLVNDSPEETIQYPKNCTFDIHTVLNKINVGIHQSRINGLEHAKGKFVLMIDQDDLLEEKALSILFSNIKDNDIIVGNGYEESSTKNGPIYHSAKHQEIVKDKKWYYLIGCAITSPGHCLIRKSSIPQLWKENVLKNNGSDDLLLWLLMLEENKKFTTVYENVYRHIYTDRNVSNNYQTIMTSCLEVVQILEKNHLIDNQMKKLFLRRLNMRKFYEGKSKVYKILAYLKYPDITYGLFQLKRM